MKNVCFLKKAFVLNHSLDCMKCIRLCENYKCLMNDRINAKIKPCKKTKNKKNRFYRPLGQESCLSIVSISLFLFFSLFLVEQETPLLIYSLRHKRRDAGKENERLGLCGDVHSLRLLPNSPQNMYFPQEITHENKE